MSGYFWRKIDIQCKNGERKFDVVIGELRYSSKRDKLIMGFLFIVYDLMLSNDLRFANL